MVAKVVLACTGCVVAELSPMSLGVMDFYIPLADRLGFEDPMPLKVKDMCNDDMICLPSMDDASGRFGIRQHVMLGSGLGGKIHKVNHVTSPKIITNATICHKFSDGVACHSSDVLQLVDVSSDVDVMTLMCHLGDAAPRCCQTDPRTGRCRRRCPVSRGATNPKTEMDYLTWNTAPISADESQEWGCHVASPGDTVFGTRQSTILDKPVVTAGTMKQSLTLVSPGKSKFIPVEDRLEEDVTMPEHIAAKCGSVGQRCSSWSDVVANFPQGISTKGRGNLSGVVHTISKVNQVMPEADSAIVCHKFEGEGFCHDINNPIRLYDVETTDGSEFTMMCHLGEGARRCCGGTDPRSGRCRRWCPPSRGAVNMKTGANYLTWMHSPLNADESQEWGCHVASPGDVVSAGSVTLI